MAKTKTDMVASIFAKEISTLERKKAELEADAVHHENLLFKHHLLYSKQQAHDLKKSVLNYQRQISLLNKMESDILSILNKP
jgi:hypothetical protein